MRSSNQTFINFSKHLVRDLKERSHRALSSVSNTYQRDVFKEI